jgi:methyl-accepting chemotaxis protein
MLKFTEKLRLATKFVLSLGSILSAIFAIFAIFAICAIVILSQSASVKENVNSQITAVIQQQDKSASSSVTINELTTIIDETMDLVAIEVVELMFMASAGVVVIVYFLFLYMIRRRLADLATMFRDVSTGDGDLQRRIDVKGNDGIDILG